MLLGMFVNVWHVRATNGWNTEANKAGGFTVQMVFKKALEAMDSGLLIHPL